MKYIKKNMIKKYKQFNESIKNLLIGPTLEEVWEIFKDLSDDELLLQSCEKGFLVGVKKSLKNNPDLIDITFGEYGNPLSTAVQFNEYDIVKYLLDIGADVNMYKGSALIHAANDGRYELCEILLKYGADPTLDFELAIDWAEEGGYFDIVKLLKEHIKSNN